MLVVVVVVVVVVRVVERKCGGKDKERSLYHT